MDGPTIVAERRCAAGAPTRISTPIISLTIIALVDALALFGMIVAVMALLSEAVSTIESISYYSYYDSEFDYALSVAQGFAAPTLVVALIGVLACLLTLCAEMTSNSNTKTKMRNGVGVCWTINIGFSVIANIMWIIKFVTTSSDSDGFGLSSFLIYGVMICDWALFFCSIALTVMCFSRRYSACSCCTSSEDYQAFYNSETGHVYPHPAVASQPAQQPMQVYPIQMQQPMVAYPPQAYPIQMQQPMVAYAQAPAQMQQPTVAFSQAPTQVQPNVSVTTTSAQ